MSVFDANRTAAEGALPLAGGALAGAEPSWIHPQANRSVVLAGQRVGFWLRRGQRNTIGLAIDAHGLRVTVPRWSTVAAADAVVQAKADWVLRKLADVAQHRLAQHSARQTWGEGARLAWLGGWLHLRLGRAPTQATRHPRVQVWGDELWVNLPDGATEAQRREAVRAWAAQVAHAHFVQRLNHFAPQVQVCWSRLCLTNASTRWGSAKSDGTIRLHWRLMQFAPEVLDYVVVHELSHLRHMDHSPRFWAVMATVVPDHVAQRARLRRERLPPW